ncbi:MAG: hypothetical protein JXR36_04170 [Bacteroidales bacterium]|nr:hypothetical protein [Bacteroidales bacterium]
MIILNVHDSKITEHIHSAKNSNIKRVAIPEPIFNAGIIEEVFSNDKTIKRTLWKNEGLKYVIDDSFENVIKIMQKQTVHGFKK